jgi:tetratricopeptide (TPR) repeat protein
MREVWAIAPSRVIHTLAGNMVSHMKHDVLELVQPVWAALAVVGFYLGIRSWGDRRRLAFAGCMVMMYLALLPVFYNPRFMMPVLPLWAVGIGTLGAFVADRLQGLAGGKGVRSRARLRRWSVVAVLAVFAAAATAKEINDSVNPGHISKGPPMELMNLARLVRSSGAPVGPTTPIAARKPQIGYLLDAPVVNIPFGDMDDLRESGAHYLLVSGMEANQFVGLRPLVWLENPKDAPTGLRFIARAAIPVGENARVASFYAIENPRPWKPEPAEMQPQEREIIPGLTRLETVRLRLAQWYLVWEPEQPMMRTLERMSPEAERHPEVLQLKGDIAMRLRNLDEAEAYYRQALAADSTNGAPLLRLASIRYLNRQAGEFNELAQRYADTAGLEPGSLTAWWEVGMEYGRRGLYAPAMTPFAIAATVQPNDPNFLENLGVALECMGWEQRALAAYTTFLGQHPDDPTITNSLENLREKIRLRESRAAGGAPKTAPEDAAETAPEG